ncbi:MAG TPA: hypothetical protein VJY99_17075 [Buttiauxella sp.]|uniref:hypothetical protein n=1 Tax=Buttiauxella sp. TaxID=1972222 RepID=UPI002B498322|nr:hypothetical protein [Buttiauxella sp.]HKM98384.1 hypothetical protein [Buttiauxella sp.]
MTRSEFSSPLEDKMKKHAEKRRAGSILEVRCLLFTVHPVCIHRVAFDDGKFAVVRCVTDVCLAPGHSLTRDAQGWHYDERIVKLLPFEYVGQTESDRGFIEYQ